MSCPDCASGTVHEGTPTGREEKMYGRDVYVANPPSGRTNGIVVIVSDGLGWGFPNARILADELARKGEWMVLLPDFMDGEFALDPRY